MIDTPLWMTFGITDMLQSSSPVCWEKKNSKLIFVTADADDVLTFAKHLWKKDVDISKDNIECQISREHVEESSAAFDGQRLSDRLFALSSPLAPFW